MKAAIATCIVAASLTTASAWSLEVSLAPTDDAHVDKAYPAKTFGGDSSLAAHHQAGKLALIRFDAATIAGQEIASATLRLFMRDVGAPAKVSVHAVTSAWRETTVTYAGRPAAETEIAASTRITADDELTIVELDVTNVVRRWADGTLADAGLSIVANGAQQILVDSKDRAGGTPAALLVTTGGVPVQSGAPTLLDLSSLPVTIERPGKYILHRDWDIVAPSETAVITIAADDVIFDMRGFEIRWSGFGNTTGIEVLGDQVTVKNGYLRSEGDNPVVVDSTGLATVLESLDVRGAAEGRLAGGSAVIRNATYVGRGDLQIGPSGVLESSRITLTRGVLLLDRGASARNNRLSAGQGGAVILHGDGVAFEYNTVASAQFGEDFIIVASNHNVIVQNRLRGQGVLVGVPVTAIRVDGTANVLRDNLAIAGNERFGTGIAFSRDGNFYGNNQMAATVPFALGNTVQTDWGANVGF